MSFEARGVDGQPLRGLEVEFEIVRELGRGGSSVVYLAVERELEREVAIKTIHPMFAADADAAARLVREARTLARLQHPNIVTFYGVRHLADGGLAVVMQYVRGERLKDRIRAIGPMPAEETRRILADVARALAHAHRHHVVHRDIKPENIYLDSDLGIARLSDFGIARSWDGEGSLTQAGLAIGTPAYMAPEQIDGAPLDGRSDLYALGMVGYEMLSGRRPWEGQNLYGIIYKQKHEALPAIETVRPDVPASLREAIAVALEKERERRWPDAEAFLSRLALPGDVFPATPAANADLAEPTTQLELVPEEGVGDALAPATALEATATQPTLPAALPDEGEDALTIPYRPAEVAARATGDAATAEAETAGVVAAIEGAVRPAGDRGSSKGREAVVPRREDGRRRALVIAAVLVLCLGGGVGAFSLMRLQAAGVRQAERAAKHAVPVVPVSSSGALASSAAPPMANDSAPGVATPAAGTAPVESPPPASATAQGTRPTVEGRGWPAHGAPAVLPKPPVISVALDSDSTPRPAHRLLGIPVESAQVAEAERSREARSRAAAVPAPAPAGATAPAPAPEADVSAAPTFTPFTVAPELENRDEIARALGRVSSGEQGAAHGRLVVWVFVDQAGLVRGTQVKASSGRPALDHAALQVARGMRFSPALNGDRHVSVWVAVPIDFSSR